MLMSAAGCQNCTLRMLDAGNAVVGCQKQNRLFGGLLVAGKEMKSIAGDGENANLVHEENNDVQENNDARRGREDKSDEERNVRPRRGS